MTRKELYNICHDEAVTYANSEQHNKRTGEQKSFLIQGYLDAMMEMPYANVARDTSYCLVKDGYYIVIYTESTTGEKKLFVQNRTIKKSIEMEMPKYDFKLDIHNDFTTDDLKKMCDMINLEYPF